MVGIYTTLLVGLASATTSNSAGNMARAYIGTLRLNVSDNSYAAADSVLPFFKFMSTPRAAASGLRALRAQAPRTPCAQDNEPRLRQTRATRAASASPSHPPTM